MMNSEYHTGLPSGRKKTRRGRRGGHRERERDGRREPGQEHGSEDKGRARMADARERDEGTTRSPSTGGGTGGPEFRMAGATQGATMSPATGAGTDGPRFDVGSAREDATESPSTGYGTGHEAPGEVGTHPGHAHLAAAVEAHNAGDYQSSKTHALNYAKITHAHQMASLGGAAGAGMPTRGGAPGLQHFNQATGEISDSPHEPDERENHDVAGEHPHFIQGMHMHKGALHRELGVPQGQTIPAKKLAKARHSSNPTERRRAILAETLKHMHHG